MRVFVLLYDSGKDSEGIHSIEIQGETIVLMFENKDDAYRYSGLLEAQDFPKPSIEELEREEVEIFCNQAGYTAKYVDTGFVPTTIDDRILIAPPEKKIECPYCNSDEVQVISEFGSTACKAFYKCMDCIETFEYFKCI